MGMLLIRETNRSNHLPSLAGLTRKEHCIELGSIFHFELKMSVPSV